MKTRYFHTPKLQLLFWWCLSFASSFLSFLPNGFSLDSEEIGHQDIYYLSNFADNNAILKKQESLVLSYKIYPSKNIEGFLYTGNYFQSKLWLNDTLIGQNGTFTTPSKRSFQNDYRYIPIKLVANKNYVLQLELLKADTNSTSCIAIYPSTIVQEKAINNFNRYLPHWLFSSATLLVILFLSLFSIGRYCQLKDNSFLFYAGFNITFFLLFLRMLEFSPNINLFFSYFPGMLVDGKSFLDLIPPIFYIFFQRSFLDLKTIYSTGHKRIEWMFWLIVAALGIQLLLYYLPNGNGLIAIFNHLIVLSLMAVGAFIIIDIFLKVKTPLATYMLVGTFMLIIGGFTTFWEDAFAENTEALYWGGQRMGLQITALLEMLFFSLGLGYKSQQRQKEIITMQGTLVEEMKKNHELENTLLKTIRQRKQKEQQYQKLLEFLSAAKEINPENEFVREVNRILRHQFKNSNFGVAQLVSLIHIPAVTLNRKMQKYFDMTTIEYLTHFRLQEAMQLLSNSDLTISQIANDTGFSTHAYFSKVFREKLGMSPSEFRK